VDLIYQIVIAIIFLSHILPVKELIFMDVLEAIRFRQSTGKVKPDPIPRELIETLLNAAVQAPNHHTVRPWRFVVLTGAVRARLGQAMADRLKAEKPDVSEANLDIERAKPLRAPVLIAVGVDKPSLPKVLEMENICAAAAATENLLLAAHAQGLGAIWRTGPAANDPNVKALLGFAPDQHLIAFVYLGYPAVELSMPSRPTHEDRTVWMA
jgi:nitroreductase